MPTLLEGTRVIQLSHRLPAALTGTYLADQGADVIRVERAGAPTRTHPVWDRGKRSITLDLADAAGRAALERLLDTADIVLDATSPATAAALGLDAGSVLADRPRLIMATIEGYAQPGLKHRHGYDALVQARLGLQWDQPSYRKDESGQFLDDAPIFLYVPLPSYGAVFLALTGIVAALFARERTGDGQHVSTSLEQGVMLWTTMFRLRAENQPDNFILVHKGARSTLYECAAGQWVHIMPLRDSPLRMLETLGLDSSQPYDRMAGVWDDTPVNRAIRSAFKTFDRADLLRRFAEVGVPAAPVQSPREMYEHPQLINNNMIVEIEDPELGTTRQMGVPFVIDGVGNAVGRGRPLPGQHTDEILAELGLVAR